MDGTCVCFVTRLAARNAELLLTLSLVQDGTISMKSHADGTKVRHIMQMKLETPCFLVTERLSCLAQHCAVLVADIIAYEHEDRFFRSPMTLGFRLML